MTHDESQILLREIRSLRCHVNECLDAVDQRPSDVTSRFESVDRRFDEFGARLTMLGARVDAMPDKAFIVRAALTVNAGLLAIIGGSLLLSHALFVPA